MGVNRKPRPVDNPFKVGINKGKDCYEDYVKHDCKLKGIPHKDRKKRTFFLSK